MTNMDVILAAEGCYFPTENETLAAMGRVIEELVLAADTDTYTIDEMAAAIQAAVEFKKSHRGVMQ